MSSADLYEDGFPHGTREGFERGCRGHACPAGVELGLSCTQAAIRYRGDYAYQKRVNAGLTPGEIVAAEREEAERQRAAEAEAKRAARVKPADKPKPIARAKPAAPAAPSWKHGTLDGYWVGGCFREDQCPATPTCAQVNLATVNGEPLPKPKPVKVAKPKRAPKPRRQMKHGTVYGSTVCKTIEGCPEHAEGRISCIEARRKYNREYAQKRARSDGFEGVRGGTIKHGTATGYQMGCRKRSECPGGPDGVKCPDASLAAERRRRREAGVPAARPKVKSDEVVRHLARLRAYGMGAVTIARATGLSKTAVRSFIYGREDYTPSGFGPRHGVIPKHIDAEKAAKLLAFAPWEQPSEDGAA